MRLRTPTFSSMPRLSVSWVCMSLSSRLVRREGPCKAEGHGWAGQSLRRHRERDVGEARDGVRGLPEGARRGEAPLGGASL